MKLIDSAPIVDRTTLVALKYDKKSKAFLKFAEAGCLEIVHERNDNSSTLHFYSSDDSVFEMCTSDLDLEEVRARTQNRIRVDRKDQEKIVLKIRGDVEELQQDYLYIHQLNETSFVLWAEGQFEITNKIYSYPSYNRSSTNFEESLQAEIDLLLNGEKPRIYNRQRAVECRVLLLRLDEIIEGEATRQLREKAIEAKISIQKELERVRLLKNKSNLAKVFGERVKEEKFILMQALIEREIGGNALSQIQRSAVEKVTRDMNVDQEVVGSLIEVQSDLDKERERVLKTLKRNVHFEELEAFVSNVKESPNLLIESCRVCGKTPRITPTTTSNGRTKRFIAKCNCGNKASDGKIGTEAVVNWNLENNQNIAITSITLIDFVGLNDEQIFEKIGCIDQFCHRRRRLISIDQELKTGVDRKRFNRIKGMVSVLAAVSRFAKEVMQRKQAKLEAISD